MTGVNVLFLPAGARGLIEPVRLLAVHQPADPSVALTELQVAGTLRKEAVLSALRVKVTGVGFRGRDDRWSGGPALLQLPPVIAAEGLLVEDLPLGAGVVETFS